MKVVSANIEYYRKVNNLTQQELAEKLGVVKESVWSWESERSWIKAEMITKLAKLFKIDEVDLFLPFRMPKDILEEMTRTMDKWDWDFVRIALGMTPLHEKEARDALVVAQAKVDLINNMKDSKTLKAPRGKK